MKKEKVIIDDIQLVGITVRTNNRNEMDPEHSKIAKTAGFYWREQVAEQFQHRCRPGVTYAVYTEYESDEHGDYTYFIGEAVSALDDQDLTQFHSLTIPGGAYQKFTTDAGEMPTVVISAWQAIWQMDSADFGGKRRYQADFEIYDQRVADPKCAVIDIFIGTV